ncbi:MAG: hypothetical protein M3345_05335 [Actinomycetota bacterium]|nr:hypothetical protein [Actinomycetota bacterium]
MSIFDMRRASALLLVALVALPACTRAAASDPEGEVHEQALAAHATANDALEASERLEARIDDLEGQLDDAKAQRDRVRKRLQQMTERLTRSSASLRDALAAARDSAGSASATAASALDRAAEIARQLSVLDSRLDYHLRGHDG